MHTPTLGFGLRDKVVLVTGASSGIGAASAAAFAREGAIVLAAARRAAEGEAVVAAIRADGGQARFLQADVTREDDIRRLVETAVADYGRLDVAFNNAGTDGRFSPYIEQDNANYEQVMNTNVRSVFWSMKHQIAAMLKSGGGAIVNNASMGALIGFQNAAVYVASKHAVMGLTKTAALEYFPQGIRINAVLPGIIDTPFQDRVWGDEASKRAFADATVAGRSGTPEEVASAALFLASEHASFFSGQGLVMDGGYVTQ
ncbi:MULTISPECIES: glucose 1-dehydrogenase [unclassified Lysobacter]|uniref:glucose 1-dehydrogenase n=1 Tax=unclassified Lysobacter TaxID=2635362 RepID=UPI00070F3F4B|nr:MULTISPECIES: glucose 1-dehydrogenase [unclassified Lysobacter]KRD31420.1 oxidoreductase [Lysobacter sp. Root916]KRD72441.1 oxidoreductase [Lysobacter sp. Root983]